MNGRFCLLMVGLIASLLFSPLVRAQTPAGVPVFEVTPLESKVNFEVSVNLKAKRVSGPPVTLKH
jgi:hypothetical protein